MYINLHSYVHIVKDVKDKNHKSTIFCIKSESDMIICFSKLPMADPYDYFFNVLD